MKIDEVVEKFCGHGGSVHKLPRGKFRCVISDFGPNTIAAGEGGTEQAAIDNVTKANYGYRLRLDFLNLAEDRKQVIGKWLLSLTHEQKNMIVEIMDADNNNPR